MPGKSLKQQIVEMEESFFSEELLHESLSSLGRLDDDPTFVEDTTNYFFDESAEVIAAVEEHLKKDTVDLNYIRRELNIILSGCGNIGAAKVAMKVNVATAHCLQGNLESFKNSFNEMKQQIEAMKGKLQPYFQLVKRAAAVKSSEA